MLCWSCHLEMPDSAEFCPHCEAEVVQAPTKDEMAIVQSVLENLSPEMVDEVRDAFQKSSTGEEFVNRIMIGDCPNCKSSNTGDCENDPVIQNCCVARCFDCAQLWCPDCGKLFQDDRSTEHDCPVWDDPK